ncbi:MAG: DNA polymerase III subunit gamma/tau, partial [Pseudoalteromonas sp.]
MSYQVLARKWRPKSFNELIGQEHVVTVLVNALTQQRLHHAYLFTGTRGVGKTTIARIFAKSLNCQQGVTATPCGTCDACIDIDQGKFIDLLEIDAASRTKVDDTREILDNVQYAPTRGRYKVYLIDEVHMLSRSSFNALLKTLEEPPEHVKFILATTDPQKLPVTVLSRCLQFHLKALSVKQISEKISEILGKEQVGFDDEAIALLAKAARGSMRDCLSLTDQSIAQGNGNISRAGVQQMLGGVDRDWVFKILIALLKQDAKALMELSLAIASYAPSYSRLSAELIQLLHQVAMAQVVDNHFSLPLEHQQMLSRFCQLMSPEDVQLYYQIVLSARKDLPYADDEQAAFDMMLLRLLAFKPIANSRNLPEISEQVENATVEQELNELALTTLSPLAPAMANENKTDDLDKAASDITEMAQNSEPANTLAQAAVGAEQHDEQPVQSQAKTTQVEISPAENTQHEAEAQDTTAPELSQQNS